MAEISLTLELVTEIVEVNNNEGCIPAIQHFRRSMGQHMYITIFESKKIVAAILNPGASFETFHGTIGQQYLRIKY